MADVTDLGILATPGRANDSCYLPGVAWRHAARQPARRRRLGHCRLAPLGHARRDNHGGARRDALLRRALRAPGHAWPAARGGARLPVARRRPGDGAARRLSWSTSSPTSASARRAASELTATCTDLSIRITRARWTQPYQIAAGTRAGRRDQRRRARPLAGRANDYLAGDRAQRARRAGRLSGRRHVRPVGRRLGTGGRVSAGCSRSRRRGSCRRSRSRRRRAPRRSSPSPPALPRS